MSAIGLRVIKVIFFILNALLWLLGSAIVGAFVFVLNFIHTDSNVKWGLIFAIYMGVVIFIITFFGFIAIVKDSQTMLINYLLLHMIFFTAAVMCLVLVVDEKEQIKEFPEVHYQKNLYQSIYNYTKAMDFIDYFQKTAKCCGLSATTDWYLAQKMSEIHSDKTTGLFQALRQMAEEEEVQEVLASHEEEYNLPPSCCSDDNIKVCSSTSEYRFNETCIATLIKYGDLLYDVSVSVCSILCSFEVLTIVFAIIAIIISKTPNSGPVPLSPYKSPPQPIPPGQPATSQDFYGLRPDSSFSTE